MIRDFHWTFRIPVYTCVSFHMYSNVFTCVHIYSHFFTFTHICSHVFTITHICSHVFTFTHICLHLLTFVHMCSRLFTCVYICLKLHLWFGIICFTVMDEGLYNYCVNVFSACLIRLTSSVESFVYTTQVLTEVQHPLLPNWTTDNNSLYKYVRVIVSF